MDEEEVLLPTKTYLVSDGRIQGFIYGIDAMVQAVDKILRTVRFEDVIYFGEYGSEIERLIGQNRDFVKADLERTVNEALSTDERISGIQNFQIQEITDKDVVSCYFEVVTIEGLVTIESWEVSL